MFRGLLGVSGLVEDRCSICDKKFIPESQGYICEECLEEIKPFHPFQYSKLGYISGYRVFGKYEGMLSEVLKLIKFKSVRPLTKSLAIRIKGHLREFYNEVNPDLFTFVPVHFFRFWNRGFDHNEEILKDTELPFESMIIRVKYAKPLISYGKEDRFKIVKDAFRIRKDWLDRIEGKKVLIFDDILTTGATSGAIAELFLSVGASEVFFYFLSKEG